MRTLLISPAGVAQLDKAAFQDAQVEQRCLLVAGSASQEASVQPAGWRTATGSAVLQSFQGSPGRGRVAGFVRSKEPVEEEGDAARPAAQVVVVVAAVVVRRRRRCRHLLPAGRQVGEEPADVGGHVSVADQRRQRPVETGHQVGDERQLAGVGRVRKRHQQVNHTGHRFFDQEAPVLVVRCLGVDQVDQPLDDASAEQQARPVASHQRGDAVQPEAQHGPEFVGRVGRVPAAQGELQDELVQRDRFGADAAVVTHDRLEHVQHQTAEARHATADGAEVHRRLSARLFAGSLFATAAPAGGGAAARRNGQAPSGRLVHRPLPPGSAFQRPDDGGRVREPRSERPLGDHLCTTAEVVIIGRGLDLVQADQQVGQFTRSAHVLPTTNDVIGTKKIMAKKNHSSSIKFDSQVMPSIGSFQQSTFTSLFHC